MRSRFPNRSQTLEVTEMAIMDSTQMEFTPEYENFEYQEYEGETLNEGEVFNEGELLELASEMLEVNSEAELDQFIGKAIRKAARKLRRAVRSPLGNALGGYLKGLAKAAIPLGAGALGGMVAGPLGTRIGSSLAKSGLGMIGFEAETLEAEDQEFEGAKAYAKTLGSAVQSAVQAPPTVDPIEVARQSVQAARAKYTAGNLGGTSSQKRHLKFPTQGKWYRNGEDLVLRGIA